MPNQDTTPLSLYGNDREYLREQERTNELLAEIAGEEYESPGDIPKGKYIVQKRLLDAAQKKNELLESIARGGGGYVTPEMYGAVGDGVTNDTLALMTMFSSAAGRYYLKNQYAITEPIEVSGHIYGGGTVLAKDKARVERSLFTVSGNTTVENITFNCDCNIEYTQDPSLVGGEGSYNIAIKSENNNYDLIVQNCTFVKGYASFISIHTNSGKIEIYDNYFDANGYLNQWIGSMINLITIGGEQPIHINGNTFISHGTSAENFAGIYLSGITTRKIIDIGNNLFKGVGRDNTGNHRLYPIDGYFNVSNLYVHDNTIIDNPFCCIRVHGGENITIANNYFGGCTAEVVNACVLIQDDVASTGVEPAGVNNVYILNNIFESLDYQYYEGIQLTSDNSGGNGNIENVVIQGNVIKGSYVYGILMDGSVTDIRILENDISVKNFGIRFMKAGASGRVFTSTRPICVAYNKIVSKGGAGILGEDDAGNIKVDIIQNYITAHTGGINLGTKSGGVHEYNRVKENTIDVDYTKNTAYALKNIYIAGCNVIEMANTTLPLDNVLNNVDEHYGNWINGVMES